MDALLEFALSYRDRGFRGVGPRQNECFLPCAGPAAELGEPAWKMLAMSMTVVE